MPTPLSKLKGVSPKLAAEFKELGLTTTNHLLTVAGTREGQELLVSQISTDSVTLVQLIKRADLLRIVGIGGVYLELLEAAGADSIHKLAHSRPESLYSKIMKVNIANQFTRRPPTLAKVRKWVNEADQLPEVVELHTDQ
ncbi:MAG: hypothetical protein MAG451_00237 [Anaerolineales bacterium]|nr:hypothetical protein [Anaerolineales bacterium]